MYAERNNKLRSRNNCREKPVLHICVCVNERAFVRVPKCVGVCM
jgi:hypothetical protein